MFTSSDLDTINAAIANSALEVRFRDRTVRYRSIQELLIAKDTIQAELESGLTKPPRAVRFATDNGFGRCWGDWQS